MNSITHADPCVNGSRVPSILDGETERARLLHAGNALLHQRRAALSHKATRSNTIDAAGISAETVRSTADPCTSGWLTALSHSLQTAQTAETAQPSPPPRDSAACRSIALQPDIACAVLQSDLAAPARVWWLCRHLDTDGRGVLPVDALRHALCDKRSQLHVVGWRRLRQLLKQGNGTFWQRDKLGRLWLFGRGRVAARLGLTYLRRKTVALDVAMLCGTIGSVRAHIHATFHAARGREGTSPAPISRATIADVTGVAPRTQQHYERVTNTERHSNISIAQPQTAANRQTYIGKHGRAAFTLVDKQGKFGRINQPYNARRLPNSYQSSLRCRHASGVRRQNRQLQTLVNYQGQGTLQLPQRINSRRHYFTDARRALGSQNGQPRYLKSAGEKHWIEVFDPSIQDQPHLAKG